MSAWNRRLGEVDPLPASIAHELEWAHVGYVARSIVNFGILVAEFPAHILRCCDHIDEGGFDFRPAASLQATVGVHPQLLRRDHFRGFVEQVADVFFRGDPRRVDVVDAWADLDRKSVV